MAGLTAPGTPVAGPDVPPACPPVRPPACPPAHRAWGTPAFTSACTCCGACLLTCPTHAIRPAHRVGQARASAALVVLEPFCTGCGECVEVCPADAVRLSPGGRPR